MFLLRSATLELKVAPWMKWHLFVRLCQWWDRITSWQCGGNRSDTLTRSWTWFYWTVQFESDTVFPQWGIFFAESMTWMGDTHIINQETHFTMQVTKDVNLTFLPGEILLVNLNLHVPWYLGEFVFRAVLVLGSEIDQTSLGKSQNSGCKKSLFVEKEKRLKTFL